jgi:cation transport ATPase
MPCDLCGEDAGLKPLSQRVGEAEKFFCCIGCMNVYVILSESGVVASGQDLRSTDLFRRSLAMGLISKGDDARSRRDETPATGETSEMLVQVSGMWCSACAWLIEHSLEKQKGVARAEVFFASDLVKVMYDPVRVAPDMLVQRIERLGYSVSELSGERSSDVMRELLLRFGVAAFFWLNVMTLSAVLYVGYFEPIAESAKHVMPWVLMALSLPVIFYSAQPILRVAFHGLRNFSVRMETLLAIGILAAFAYSVFETIRGGTHLYFDTATAIVTFVLAGKLLERGAKDDTMQSISRLHRLMPAKARLAPVDCDGWERFVSVASLNVGDVILVKAGERIPADGIVVGGSCDADESLLSGESVPIAKTAGSAVVSGSANLGGVIHVKVTRASVDSALSRIIALVEQAINSRSSLERVVDRIARVFVPVVLLLAAGTFAVSWLGGFSDGGGSLLRAIAVLVIACPCALGLATPLAVTAAVGRASRDGILVGDARQLERVRALDTVVFDKTGTLTAGDFAVVHRDLPLDVLSSVASLERYSEHPLGHAIVRTAIPPPAWR